MDFLKLESTERGVMATMRVEMPPDFAVTVQTLVANPYSVTIGQLHAEVMERAAELLSTRAAQLREESASTH